MKSILIRNPHELKIALYGKPEADFAITLQGGVYSRKTIRYNQKTGKFRVINCIDDSKQTLTEGQIMDRSYTNIGRAMRQRAFLLIPN